MLLNLISLGVRVVHHIKKDDDLDSLYDHLKIEDEFRPNEVRKLSGKCRVRVQLFTTHIFNF